MAALNSKDTNVRLDLIEIKRYRSCTETTFSPNAELSALVGVNGSGKTNLLQAVRLLNGSRRRVVRRAADNIPRGIESELTAWFSLNNGAQKVGLKTRLSIVESVRSTDELVTVSETWNLQEITGTKGWRALPPIEMFRDSARGPTRQEQVFLFHEFSRYGTEKSDVELMMRPPVLDAISAISDFREGIAYYSASRFTDPNRCPSSFEVDEDGRLSETYTNRGSVHQKFLYDLYNLKTSNPALYDEYCKFISRKQLGLVSRLTWKEIELSSHTAEVRSGGGVKRARKTKTLVIPKIQMGPAYITFNQLSEGTFKTLALIFYVVTDSSRLLMVEEPEVCVHHGLLSKIISTLKSYSKIKQTIISTHSDLLIDELEPENIFVVEMVRGGTQVKQLDKWLTKNGKDALHTYLAESGSLGEYWRSGGLS